MYRLTPPTTAFRAGRRGSLWGRVKNDRGKAIVLFADGRIQTLEVAPPHSDAGVLKVWSGGRTYDITDDEAALLTAAGYESCLEAAA